MVCVPRLLSLEQVYLLLFPLLILFQLHICIHKYRNLNHLPSKNPHQFVHNPLCTGLLHNLHHRPLLFHLVMVHIMHKLKALMI
ncbi:hypothetical protein EJD97_024801 [Solanum chilense]|uniref:Uncharacterized protein n=1 Tax=Solanum chilense TaxID=4083 RepID=A0A6N2C8W0_SOLCI|nr:hypothetical protein EJD97_024801 [Solanum chilense]